MQIKIGDKMVEAEMKNGVPTIKGEAERVVNANGGVDVIIKVPCLQIQAKKEK